MRKTVSLIHFSPTGSSERIGLEIAEKLGGDIAEYDICVPEAREITFAPEDTVVVSVPVYMGRVPKLAIEKLQAITGGGATAVCVVVYGNRHYNDALLELSEVLQAQGFAVVAGAAIVAQHSIDPSIAKNRPNGEDLREIDAFAEGVAKKLKGEHAAEAVAFPGNHPYIELPGGTRPIVTSESCTRCRLCAEKCPVLAIPKEAPNTTELDKCINCMRCIHICPAQARHIPTPVFEKLHQYMSQYAAPKASEFYL